MNDHQTQTLVLFSMCIAFASGVGALSYIAALLTRGALQLFFVLLFAVLVLIPSAILSPLVLPTVIATAVLSVAPAFWEQRLSEKAVEWLKCFLLIWMATFQSVVVGWALGSFAASYVNLPDSVYSPIPVLTVGLALMPPSISLFRWIVHNSWTRPGVERHLYEGEVE